MDRLFWVAVAVLILVTDATAATIPKKIQHVIIIVQENRTPDNLFHGLPNADIANSGLDSHGHVIPLAPVSLQTRYDLDHSHAAFEAMFDRGKMDRADKVKVFCEPDCPAPHPQFAYVSPAEVQPYFDLAEQYAFADRMFQTNQGPSFPAHQFVISGTSAPTAGSDLFVAENPQGIFRAGTNTGCTAPARERVLMIDPAGRESSLRYPCFEHFTLMDLLDSKLLSWRYYTPFAQFYWTAPNAIHHLRFGPDWKNIVVPQTQVLTDIDTGHLPAVSWVIPSGQESDHAAVNDGSGPSWVAAIVNAVGKSRYWMNTVIFITWDDWGGWYDHVPPPIYNSYEYGFRVPLIVVSPYAKIGYVSHQTHDFGSILKFIEELFELPSLGFADSRADDLLDCFDFTQAPRSFRVIHVKPRFNEEFFLNDRRPPLDPDDD